MFYDKVIRNNSECWINDTTSVNAWLNIFVITKNAYRMVIYLWRVEQCRYSQGELTGGVTANQSRSILKQGEEEGRDGAILTGVGERTQKKQLERLDTVI